MTYQEILIWIENHLLGLVAKINGKLSISYLDDQGIPQDVASDSLIAGVLEINKKELV